MSGPTYCTAASMFRLERPLRADSVGEGGTRSFRSTDKPLVEPPLTPQRVAAHVPLHQSSRADRTVAGHCAGVV